MGAESGDAMTGAEAAALRKELGYTQGQLAALLSCSTPTVSRSEAAAEVPAAHAEALKKLPPATRGEGSRGAYRKATPPPLPRKAMGQRQPPARPRATPPREEAAAPAPQARTVAEEQPVCSADELGAVLLEGEDLRRYWVRVATWRQWLLAKRRVGEGRPCRP